MSLKTLSPFLRIKLDKSAKKASSISTSWKGGKCSLEGKKKVPWAAYISGHSLASLFNVCGSTNHATLSRMYIVPVCVCTYQSTGPVDSKVCRVPGSEDTRDRKEEEGGEGREKEKGNWQSERRISRKRTNKQLFFFSD